MYLCAWIGDADVTSRTVILQTGVGIEGSLNRITAPMDPDEMGREWPTIKALQTDEVQTAQTGDADSKPEHWHRQVEGDRVRSLVAIPIMHEDTKIWCVKHRVRAIERVRRTGAKDAQAVW